MAEARTLDVQDFIDTHRAGRRRAERDHPHVRVLPCEPQRISAIPHSRECAHPRARLSHNFPSLAPTGTLLLCVPYFMSHLVFGYLTSWLPTLINGAGLL
jgi:hypothetical protein